MAIDPKKLKSLIKRDGARPFDKKPGGKVQAHVEDDDDQDSGKSGGDGGEQEPGEEEHGQEVALDEEALEEIGLKVQNGDGDEGLMARAEELDEDNTPPETVADVAQWHHAKALVDPRWDEYDLPWAVVMHVYKALGGKFTDEQEHHKPGSDEADDEDASDVGDDDSGDISQNAD